MDRPMVLLGLQRSHVMVPHSMMRVMVPCNVAMWLCRHRLGCRGNRALLCGTRGTHGKSDTGTTLNLGRQGKRWDDDEHADRNRAQNATKQNVHDEVPAKWITLRPCYHNLRALAG
jgi:hypothetical protein